MEWCGIAHCREREREREREEGEREEGGREREREREGERVRERERRGCLPFRPWVEAILQRGVGLLLPHVYRHVPSSGMGHDMHESSHAMSDMTAEVIPQGHCGRETQ